jgi:hypothetical protein
MVTELLQYVMAYIQMKKCKTCGKKYTDYKDIKYPCNDCWKADEFVAGGNKNERWVIAYDIISELQCSCNHYHSDSPKLCTERNCECRKFSCRIINKTDIVTASSKGEAVQSVCDREKGLRPEYGFFFIGGCKAEEYTEGMDLTKPKYKEL